jgi:hypothetical protein
LLAVFCIVRADLSSTGEAAAELFFDLPLPFCGFLMLVPEVLPLADLLTVGLREPVRGVGCPCLLDIGALNVISGCNIFHVATP